ncbi:helix-turn-helix domain-containing protein [Budviciaceae bacterium CWB-B4]|uniref:Helix-turn-helix domain-containing protein n=1 Tax=Limnobaculum xujianqingii TaxID=2738837 RepID=A0A9D7AFE2_9GAMM|nr:helix-turn-helix domain-containing protein [Limnobaculum xujianqingii]MBK5071724.1 helix-turn-helix domain-containing protein [Limnobaculum xujianqingii]MBK5175033.1 helix-turn-helix domain-containing protein [Limnobaculum xujianqingii]
MPDTFPDYTKHLQLVMDAFINSNKAQKVTIPKNNKYLITDNIYCIQKGYFSIYMKHGERLMAYYEGQAIFGLTNYYTDPIYFYIKPSRTCTVYTVTTEEAQRIIAEENLYQSINYVLATNMARFFRIYEKTIGPNNYTFIRLLLQELNQASDEIKSSVTVASYIIKRSGLSRSYVMLVLSELRKGDYITMKNGKLTGITSLPERF